MKNNKFKVLLWVSVLFFSLMITPCDGFEYTVSKDFDKIAGIETLHVCNNRDDCSWDTSRSSGVAPAECGLQDYDVVPGCDYVAGR